MTDWDKLDAELDAGKPDYKLLRFILWGLIAFWAIILAALFR